MTNTKFVLSTHAAPRGADARFVIHNVGNKTQHLRGRQGESRHGQVADRLQRDGQARQKKILILFLDIRGKIPYYSGLAGRP